jgi:hypothetical protein
MHNLRKALVVGINHYEHDSTLFGCVDDAHSVRTVLERHSDGSVNFSVKLMTCAGRADQIRRAHVKDAIKELFAFDDEVALFYFAGHGRVEMTGGYLLASDAQRGDDGVSLDEVMTLANASRARNKVIVLDSCHSGIAGALPPIAAVSALAEGVTILTASTAEQYASEDQRSGVFTRLLVDALSGSACNLVGDVSPGSIYAHIDESLGPWEQRPVFKTNVKNFVTLRKVQPPVDTADLRRIVEFFPSRGARFPLDPSFEPEWRGRDAATPPPDPEATRKFEILQKYNRVNLVVPVDAPHMWHAAMGSTSCRLTALGEHYRRLVERKLI